MWDRRTSADLYFICTLMNYRHKQHAYWIRDSIVVAEKTILISTVYAIPYEDYSWPCLWQTLTQLVLPAQL